tara:strand:+ start:41 stop:370 length:330 start_codon:yes stop_codon:yes gene_type:complete
MIIKNLDSYLYIKPDKTKIQEVKTYFDSKSKISSSIIDLAKIDINREDVLECLKKINNFLNASNKSCVFVNQLSIDEIHSVDLVFLPTIKEAIDFLNMDEIERDLKKKE